MNQFRTPQDPGMPMCTSSKTLQSNVLLARARVACVAQSTKWVVRCTVPSWMGAVACETLVPRIGSSTPAWNRPTFRYTAQNDHQGRPSAMHQLLGHPRPGTPEYTSISRSAFASPVCCREGNCAWLSSTSLTKQLLQIHTALRHTHTHIQQVKKSKSSKTWSLFSL